MNRKNEIENKDIAHNKIKIKKNTGRNVELFMQRESEINKALENTKINNLMGFKANWEDGQLAKGVTIDKKRNETRLQDEIYLSNKQMQLEKAERIKNFFKESYRIWEKELHEKGLALVKDE